MSSWIEYTVPQWRDLQMRELDVDEAYLVPKSAYDQTIYIYSLSEECYTCPYSRVKAVHQNRSEESLKFKVTHPISFKVFDHDVGQYAPGNITEMCNVQTSMEEFGVYNFSVHFNGSCEIVTDKPGVDVNLSILSVVLLGLLLGVFAKILLYTVNKFRLPTAIETAVAAESSSLSKPVGKKRMRSLDAFRGFVIVLMIFVNCGGGGYWWIEHAPWNGLHIADIVFPSFLWIMGVCIPISIKSQLSRGLTKKSICKKIVWRSLKMFFIGVCLNSINGPQLENLRIMGVLQRFGVAFLCVGIMYTVFARTEYVMPQSGCRRATFDLILIKEQVIALVSLIVISLGVMFGINAPGCPRGYIGPGGKDLYAAHPNCIGGIVGYLDREILGENHIYQHPTAKYLYDSKAFDPEGVFGCLLTIVQVFFGVICGTVLMVYTEWIPRVKRWLLWAISLGLLGGILCLFSRESGWIPINKNLWSLSFVLVTSSLSFALLSFLYYIIDVRQMWTGYPFAECGMNAIILYVGHTVFHKMLPWHWTIGAMNTHFVLLLRCTWITTLWIGIAVYLDKIKFYYVL